MADQTPPQMSPAPREGTSFAGIPFTPPPTTPREYSHARGVARILEDENAGLQKDLRTLTEEIKLRDSELSECRVELHSLKSKVLSAQETASFREDLLKKREEAAELDQERLLKDRNVLRERIAGMERELERCRAQLQEEQQRRRNESGAVLPEAPSQTSATQESGACLQEAKRRRIDEHVPAEAEDTLSPQERVLRERDVEILELQQCTQELRAKLASASSSTLEKEKQRVKEREDAEREMARLKEEMLRLRCHLHAARPPFSGDSDQKVITFDDAQEAIQSCEQFRRQIPALIDENRELRHRIAMRQLRSSNAQEEEEGEQVSELRRQLEEAQGELQRHKNERERTVHESAAEVHGERPTVGEDVQEARDGSEDEEVRSRRDKLRLEVRALGHKADRLQDQLNAETAKTRRLQQEIEQAGLQRDFELESRNYYKSQEAELRSELKETRKERRASEHQLRVCETRLKVYEEAWKRCSLGASDEASIRMPPVGGGGDAEALIAGILERLGRASDKVESGVDAEEWSRQQTEIRMLRKEKARHAAEAKEHEAARASAESARAATQEQLHDARKALQLAEEKLKAEAAKHPEEHGTATTNDAPVEQVSTAVTDQMRKQLAENARIIEVNEKSLEDQAKIIEEQEAVLKQKQQELSEKKSEAASVKRQLDSEEQKRAEWEKERETQLAQLATREKEVQRREQQLQSEIGQKEEEVKRAEADRSTALTEAEEASAEVAKLKEELSRLGKQMKDKDAANQAQVAEVGELQARVKELEQGRTQGIDDILHRGSGQLPDEIAAGLRERDQELQSLRQIVTKMPVSKELQESELRVFNDCLQARLDRTERQLQCEQHRRLELETRVTDLSAANRDVSTLQQEKERNARELYEHKRTVSELRAQLTQAEEDRDTLTRENEEARSEIQAVTNQYKEELERGKAMREELKSAREESGTLRGRVAETENAAKVAEEKLEANQKMKQRYEAVVRKHREAKNEAQKERDLAIEERDKANAREAAYQEKVTAADEAVKQKATELESFRKRAIAAPRLQKRVRELEEQIRKLEEQNTAQAVSAAKETPPATPPSAGAEARTSSPTQVPGGALRQKAAPASSAFVPATAAKAPNPTSEGGGPVADGAKPGTPPLTAGEVVVVDDDDEESEDQPAGGRAEQLPGGGTAAAQAAVQAVAAKRRLAGKGPLDSGEGA